MSIQWGRIVSEISQVRQAAADGFDFAQPARDLAVDLGREQGFQDRARAQDDGIPFRVCALPLPEDVRVTQKGFNIYVWGEQLKKAAHRLAQLGCRKLVWSDGRTRVLPVEGATAGFKEQVLQFLSLLCTAAADFGMSVLIEPLGPRRTNFLNTMKETVEFVSRLGMENLLFSISLRELEQIGLPPSDLHDYIGKIGHVQMDNPRFYDGARVCPRPKDGYDYRRFIHALREAGYAADISLAEDADAEALAYCRGLWNEQR